jgi:hypothetical protein
MTTLNLGHSAFVTATFPNLFFKDYSVTGKIEDCKILLKVTRFLHLLLFVRIIPAFHVHRYRLLLWPVSLSATTERLISALISALIKRSVVAERACTYSFPRTNFCPSYHPPKPHPFTIFAVVAQAMSAVFKFPANVEDFSIDLDCDKSELLIVLTCRDGDPSSSLSQLPQMILAHLVMDSLLFK